MAIQPTSEAQVVQRSRMAERNKAICDYYLDAHTITECGRKFGLRRQRVQQILKSGGVWKPHEKSDRSEFVGINVSAEVKDALKQKAKKRGVSLSRLAHQELAKVANTEEGE